jgi:short-subunit dehydrogenase
MIINKKVIILTGGAGGIGYATLIEITKNSEMEVCLIDLPKSLQNFQKEHLEFSKKVNLYPCDLKNKKEIQFVVKRIISVHKKIDVLVNNAGIMRPNSFLDTTDLEIEEQIQVNLLGTIFMTKECLPHIIITRGKIINISSLAGVIPAPFHSIYSASKFAIRSFSLSLGLELKNVGVGVVCVLPGTIDSPMTSYMASKNSSPMAYLNPPLDASCVAKAIIKAINKNKPEIYVPYSQGLLARIGLFFPSLLQKIYPIMSKMGIKNQKKWIQEGKF